MILDLKKFVPHKYCIENETIPLRVWTDDWPLPKKLRFIKYTTEVTTSHHTKVHIVNHGLFGAVESEKNFKNRIYKNKTPRKWGKGKKSGRRFDYSLINGMVLIKILSKCNNLNLTSRNLLFDKNYLRIRLKDNEYGIWYRSEEGQIRSCILPKKIELDANFFEMIGILDGEMNKKISSKKRGQSLKISNTEPKIIKFLMKSFKKYFFINEKSWRASITVNSKINYFSQNDDKILKNFWSDLTRTPLNNFTKTTISKKYLSKKSPKGILQIRYNNAMFFNVLINIMRGIRKIILSNNVYTESYLRGLAAAEGGVGKVYKRKTEGLRIVFISSTNHKDKLFYMQCLRKLGINSYGEYPLRVEIYSKSNFLKLYNIDLFKYHPERKKNFIKYFKLSFHNA